MAWRTGMSAAPTAPVETDRTGLKASGSARRAIHAKLKPNPTGSASTGTITKAAPMSTT